MRNSLFFLILSLVLSLASAADIPYGVYSVNLINKPKCVEFYYNKDKLYCSPIAQTIKPIDPAILNYEKFNISLDDRFWVVAWGVRENFSSALKYIPKDDVLDHWSEMITSEYLPGLQSTISPRQYFNRVIESITNAGYHPIIIITKETPDEVIAEFQVKSANVNQDELQRIIKTDDGFYDLHYATRTSDMGSDARTKWLSNLQKSTLKK